MTREEAIEVLEVHKAHWERLLDNGICDVLEGGNTIQALKVAISALKNEQTDGDLISRQAVIDLLNRLIEVERKQGTDVMNYGRERVNAYESILDEIESDYLFPSMPSAEKIAECDNNHDCEHCDWTECPLEVEKETDGESK